MPCGLVSTWKKSCFGPLLHIRHNKKLRWVKCRFVKKISFMRIKENTTTCSTASVFYTNFLFFFVHTTKKQIFSAEYSNTKRVDPSPKPVPLCCILKERICLVSYDLISLNKMILQPRRELELN